jgi:hypothetical protein
VIDAYNPYNIMRRLGSGSGIVERDVAVEEAL